MTDKARIKDIFTSIQGEGLFVGHKQLFIRFCGCNLACQYCDTDFHINNSLEYTVEELVEIIKKHADCHSVSLTGGEPLLNTGFMKEFLPQCPLPVYLETKLVSVDSDGAMVSDSEGKFKIKADTVITALGYKPNPVFKKKKNVHYVGDANEVGNLRTVIWNAWDVCMKI